jgi:hypothetical protein
VARRNRRHQSHWSSSGVGFDGKSNSSYTRQPNLVRCAKAAILWTGIETVVFGTSIRSLQRLGWRQIDIRAEEVDSSQSCVELHADRRSDGAGM